MSHLLDGIHTVRFLGAVGFTEVRSTEYSISKVDLSVSVIPVSDGKGGGPTSSSSLSNWSPSLSGVFVPFLLDLEGGVL